MENITLKGTNQLSRLQHNPWNQVTWKKSWIHGLRIMKAGFIRNSASPVTDPPTTVGSTQVYQEPARLLQNEVGLKKSCFFLATARDENTTAATTTTCFVNNIFLCTPNIERRFKAHSQNNFKSNSLKRTFKIWCQEQEIMVLPISISSTMQRSHHYQN